MKLISVDGPMGAGKTTLVALLTELFPNSAAVIYSKEDDDAQLARFDSVKRFRKDTYLLRREVDDIFNNCEYHREYMQECSFSVSMVRLMMIEASFELQSLEYVFVDTFWDPIWWFKPETVPEYVKRLQERVKVPDVSLFIRERGARLHQFRVARDIDKPVTEGEEFYKISDERMYSFLEWAPSRISNFHVLSRTAPHNVLRKAMAIINEDGGE